MTKDEKIKLICEMATKIYIQDVEEQRSLPEYKTKGYNPDELAFDAVWIAAGIYKKVENNLSDKN